MCLVAIANRASVQFPLVIAANRDELHARPSSPAAWWDDAPDVIGGRDLLHGGSWLAFSKRAGSWAAVTNLRGADRTAESRSRGALVGDFVRGGLSALNYSTTIGARAGEYGGFHFLSGDRDGAVYLASTDGTPRALPEGVFAFSNAPAGEVWPKTARIEEAMEQFLNTSGSADELARSLLQFLTTPAASILMRGRTLIEEIETEPFVVGEVYGTRATTVVVVDQNDDVLFVEKTFGPGRASTTPPMAFRFRIDQPEARVLLVDDDDDLRRVLARALQLEGFIVDQARSGNEALAMIRERSFDVMVLDLVMLEGGGREVLAALDGFPHPPAAVVVSALADTWPLNKRRADVPVLSKPVRLEQLVAAMRDVLARRTA